jgi:hypothetical protein
MRILRTPLLTVAGGVLMAFTVVMLVTSPAPVIRFTPRMNSVITDPGGIDLWTGEVRPVRMSAYDLEGKFVKEFIIPEDPDDLRVIPVPVSFAVGSLLTLTVITLASRRPRTTSPNPVVPAA